MKTKQRRKAPREDLEPVPRQENREPSPLLKRPLDEALQDPELLDAIDLRARLVPLIGPLRPLRPHDDFLGNLASYAIDASLDECGIDLKNASAFWCWLMATVRPLPLDPDDLVRAEVEFFFPVLRDELTWFRDPFHPRPNQRWKWDDLIPADPNGVRLTDSMLEEILRRSGLIAKDESVDELDVKGNLEECRHAGLQWAEPPKPPSRKRPEGGRSARTKAVERPTKKGSPRPRLSLMNVLRISETYPIRHLPVECFCEADPFVFVSVLAGVYDLDDVVGLTPGAAALVTAARLLCETDDY